MSQVLYHIGTSGWTYPHWKGIFYPPRLPRSRWLDYYASQFNTVEVNATFYRFFSDQTYLSWRERAPEAFLYSLKTPRLITHEKLLVESGQDIQAFCRSASLLADKLGLILLQVSPAAPYDLNRLENTLVAFDLPGKTAVEFRRAEWLTPEVRKLLECYQAIFVNVDSPDTQLTDWLTTDTAYLRLHGRRRWYSADYSTPELEGIAEIARGAVERGARQVYIYFNNDVGGYAPKNAIVLKNML